MLLTFLGLCAICFYCKRELEFKEKFIIFLGFVLNVGKPGGGVDG